MSTATDTPVTDEQPETLPFEETKFPDKVARPTDEFEALSLIPGMSQIRRANGDLEQTIFPRSALLLVGITNIADHCLRRNLKPLTPTAPELFGLPLKEMLMEYLPVAKERSRRFEALFKLIRDPYTAAGDLSQRCPECSNPNLVADAGFTLLVPEILPSCLPLLIEEGFRFTANFHEKIVQQLARKFIMETPPARFAGKGSQSIMPQIVELLDTVMKDGTPQFANEIGVHLMRIMGATAPHYEPVRTGLLRALRRYQRMPEKQWGAEIEAAIQCEYACYLR